MGRGRTCNSGNPGPYDGRSREGKAWERGYARGRAGDPIPESARLLSTWGAYRQGHETGINHRLHAAATSGGER
jgi:hypothetical protein